MVDADGGGCAPRKEKDGSPSEPNPRARRFVGAGPAFEAPAGADCVASSPRPRPPSSTCVDKRRSDATAGVPRHCAAEKTRDAPPRSRRGQPDTSDAGSASGLWSKRSAPSRVNRAPSVGSDPRRAPRLRPSGGDPDSTDAGVRGELAREPGDESAVPAATPASDPPLPPPPPFPPPAEEDGCVVPGPPSSPRTRLSCTDARRGRPSPAAKSRSRARRQCRPPVSGVAASDAGGAAADPSPPGPARWPGRGTTAGRWEERLLTLCWWCCGCWRPDGPCGKSLRSQGTSPRAPAARMATNTSSRWASVKNHDRALLCAVHGALSAGHDVISRAASDDRRNGSSRATPPPRLEGVACE